VACKLCSATFNTVEEGCETELDDVHRNVAPANLWGNRWTSLESF
jgi:hypothetical protein